jgi:hypothetical protein
MKKFYFLMLSSIASPIFSQENELLFLNPTQEYIYYSESESVNNKVVFKSNEVLENNNGCFEIYKISDNSFVYNLSLPFECLEVNTSKTINLTYKKADNIIDTATLKIKLFYPPKITIGGKIEGEKLDPNNLDITPYFIGNDTFLNKTTVILSSNWSIFLKDKETINFSVTSGKLTDKFKKKIRKNYDNISMIRVDCLIYNESLNYRSKIKANFNF